MVVVQAFIPACMSFSASLLWIELVNLGPHLFCFSFFQMLTGYSFQGPCQIIFLSVQLGLSQENSYTTLFYVANINPSLNIKHPNVLKSWYLTLCEKWLWVGQMSPKTSRRSLTYLNLQLIVFKMFTSLSPHCL